MKTNQILVVLGWDILRFFFFFLAALKRMEFPGQGSGSSCTCDNTDCLTHRARPGIQPASQHSRDATDPVGPQQELWVGMFFEFLLLDKHRSFQQLSELFPGLLVSIFSFFSILTLLFPRQHF